MLQVHKSIQTSPELLRKYMISLQISSSPPDSPNTPDETIRTKTVAVIQTLNDFDDTNNKIRETFTIRNRCKSGDGVKYTQISEYKTDMNSTDEPVVKVKELVVLDKNQLDNLDKLQIASSGERFKKLSHASIELTEVVNNTTTVTEFPFDTENEQESKTIQAI